LHLQAIDARPISDLKQIWNYLVRTAENASASEVPGFATRWSTYTADEKTIKWITNCSWPGNFRQLEYAAREFVRRGGGAGTIATDYPVLRDVLGKIGKKPRPLTNSTDEEARPIAVTGSSSRWPSAPVLLDAMEALKSSTLDELLDALLGAVTNAVIEQEGGSRATAAKRLGMTRGALSKRVLRAKTLSKRVLRAKKG